MDSINTHNHDKISTVPKQALLELAEISILLDSYDDIFSDFDPSPYSERTLSDDYFNINDRRFPSRGKLLGSEFKSKFLLQSVW